MRLVRSPFHRRTRQVTGSLVPGQKLFGFYSFEPRNAGVGIRCYCHKRRELDAFIVATVMLVGTEGFEEMVSDAESTGARTLCGVVSRGGGVG